jgi:hypothetical protein
MTNRTSNEFHFKLLKIAAGEPPARRINLPAFDR